MARVDRLARSERPLKRGPAVAQPEASELGAPLVDRVVEPGDCLVIPRGFPHAAETVDDESAHLTIGVMAVTWSRLLRDRIDRIGSGTSLADPVGPSGRPPRATPPLSALAALGDLDTAGLSRRTSGGASRRPGCAPGAGRARRRRPRRRHAGTAAVDRRPGRWWTQALPALGDRRLRFPLECTPVITQVLRAERGVCANELRCTRRRVAGCRAPAPRGRRRRRSCLSSSARSPPRRNEPIFATASQVRRWLLVEVRGSWGRDPVTNTDLGRHVTDDWRDRVRTSAPGRRDPP